MLKRGTRELLRAAQEGDVARLRQVMADIRSQQPELSEEDVLALHDAEGATALHRAAGSGQLAAVKALLEQGALVGARKDKYKTALHEAAAGGHAGVVEALLQAGASVDAKKSNDWTPLMYACAHGHVDTARGLLGAGADVQATNREGASALYLAAREGHIPCIRLLVECGAKVNHLTHNSRTPLLGYVLASRVRAHTTDALGCGGRSAVENGHLDVVDLLLHLGADPLISDGRGMTAWHACAVRGDADLLNLLAKHTGAPKPGQLRDVLGRTLLHYAALEEHTEFMDVLLQVTATARAGIWVLPSLTLAAALRSVGTRR